ncbi:MAG: septation protein SpoVG family protein [Krumholzibacteria bacterium]|nr:septation protein SpoVG family protein [Candidatus Krumholzibacteria bacterium]
MEISEIRITLRDDNKLKGFASITLENAFVVRGLKIIEGASGLFIAMPSRKRKDGTFQDIAHPINMATREWMENQVIAAYRREMQRVENGEIPPPSRFGSYDDDDRGVMEGSY